MMQKAGSLFEYQSLWSIILKAKEEKSHDFINQCRKAFETFRHSFMIKTDRKIRIKGNCLKLIKEQIQIT